MGQRIPCFEKNIDDAHQPSVYNSNTKAYHFSICFWFVGELIGGIKS